MTAWAERSVPFQQYHGMMSGSRNQPSLTRATSSLPPRLEKQFSIKVQVFGRGRTIIGGRPFGKNLK